MNLPPDEITEEELVNTFPNSRLRELARATGLVEREGDKLEADALFWALTLSFLSAGHRTIEAFRQTYIGTFGSSLAYSSFHKWFTPELCEFLRDLLKEVLYDLKHESDRLQERFDEFREVFIIDTTIITLFQKLFEEFPGFGDDHAGAKLHVVESASIGLPMDFFITDSPTYESTHVVMYPLEKTRCCCTIWPSLSTGRWT